MVSPSTLWSYPRWLLYPGNKHARVPVVTPANLIYTITPQAKIIAIFRDPTLIDVGELPSARINERRDGLLPL